jgi:hypothetical protein
MENESKGLGDTIKKITNAVGIKQCGACKKRQEKLNQMFPYKTKQIETSADETPEDKEQLSDHDKLVLENKKQQMAMLAKVRQKLFR